MGILLSLIWTVVLFISVYSVCKKKHLLFEDRFSMTMCAAVSMATSFTIALHLELLLSFMQSGIILLVPMVSGLGVGLLLGAIIKAPAALNSVYNGVMGSVMGAALGKVLINPALCNIPLETDVMIMSNMNIIIIFVSLLHTILLLLILYSFRV